MTWTVVDMGNKKSPGKDSENPEESNNQENEVDQTNDIQEPETVNDNVTLVADQTGSPTESNVSKRDYDRLIAKVRNSGTLFVLAGLLVIFTTGCNVGWRQGYVNAIMQCHLGLFLLGLGVTVVRLSQFLNYDTTMPYNGQLTRKQLEQWTAFSYWIGRGAILFGILMFSVVLGTYSSTWRDMRMQTSALTVGLVLSLVLMGIWIFSIGPHNILTAIQYLCGKSSQNDKEEEDGSDKVGQAAWNLATKVVGYTKNSQKTEESAEGKKDEEWMDEPEVMVTKEEFEVVTGKILHVGILFFLAGFLLMVSLSFGFTGYYNGSTSIALHCLLSFFLLGSGVAIIQMSRYFSSGLLPGYQVYGMEKTSFKKKDFDAWKSFVLKVGRGSVIIGVVMFIASLVAYDYYGWNWEEKQKQMNSLAINILFAFLDIGIWTCISGPKNCLETFKIFVLALLKIPSGGHGMRFRSVEEVKNKSAKCRMFQFFTSVSLTIAGTLMMVSDMILEGRGLSPNKWEFSIGSILSIPFQVTGILWLATLIKPSRIGSGLTLSFSIASMTIGFILCLERYAAYHPDHIDFTKTFVSEGWNFDRFYKDTLKDWSGNMLFPLLPWTPIVVARGVVPAFLTAISLGGIWTSFNLLISSKKEDEIKEVPERRIMTNILFKFLGILLILTGTASVAIRFLSWNLNTRFERIYSYEFSWHYMIALPWMIAGILCLKARPKATHPTRLALFCMAGALLTCGTIYIIGYKYDEMRITSNNEEYITNSYRACPADDGQFCLKWTHNIDGYVSNKYYNDYGSYNTERSTNNDQSEMACIPMERRCDGVLDFFFGPSDKVDYNPETKTVDFIFNGTRQSLDLDKYRKNYKMDTCNSHTYDSSSNFVKYYAMFADEMYCYQENLFLDITDLTCIGFGGLASLILWFLTYDAIKVTLVNLFKHAKESWKQIQDVPSF